MKKNLFEVFKLNESSFQLDSNGVYLVFYDEDMPENIGAVYKFVDFQDAADYIAESGYASHKPDEIERQLQTEKRYNEAHGSTWIVLSPQKFKDYTKKSNPEPQKNKDEFNPEQD